MYPFLFLLGKPEMNRVNTFAYLGSAVATAMFLWTLIQQYCPPYLRAHVDKYSKRVSGFMYPYIQIRINEFTGERLKRSEAYSAIESYLAIKSATQAKRLKADIGRNQKNHSLVLSMDDHEEVADEFQGVNVWWFSGKNTVNSRPISLFPTTEERSYYILRFHKRHREFIMGSYLNHVMKEGNAIKVQNRQRKLYTNSGSYWSHIVFEHRATFETLAMDPTKKEEIIEDLITFSKAEDFYARIGRAWKRGYLLYGPPGTGKSTLIAAMANLLEYDLYDLELTAVRDNTELRKLLIDIPSKAVVLIEDIDCSLDLTGQRKEEKKKKKKEERDSDDDDDRHGGTSRVTLSGLLNSIDGLWSTSGGERLVVFTTNYVEKLDPALIRKGRMDKHIEMSYCRFQSFKVLAKNYLGIDSHHLFPTIGKLLGEVEMTPAEVAEHLMPKTASRNVDNNLNSLIRALEETKEAKAKAKAEEEAKQIEPKPAEIKVQEKEQSSSEGSSMDEIILV